MFRMDHVLLALVALFLRLAHCQYGSTTVSAYASVSAVPVVTSTDGTFQWPAGSSGGSFNQGALMNISWTTDFETVNLWLVVNEQWDHPFGIASNYAKESITWTVTCPNDACQYPFLFRAVDAQGSDEEQQQGGFVSRLFWITSTDKTTSSATLTPLSTTGDLSPTAASTTSASRARKASTSPSNTPAPAAASNSVPIGVGVGVGVGAALLIVGGFFLWRRIHKKNKPGYAPPPSEMAPNTPGNDSWSWYDTNTAQSTANAKWAPPHYQQQPVEAYGKPVNTLVEAPSSNQRDPQELDASK